MKENLYEKPHCSSAYLRPTVTYASETWVLKENMKNELMIFERRIMREIFGPTRTDYGYWRIRSNQEINEIFSVT